MKILLLDIETSPNLADVWSLWNQNVSLSQLRESSRTICFAAKWYKAPKKETMFFSEWEDDHEDMILKAKHLMNEADAIVTYNGDKFDLPTLNGEIARDSLWPPAPYKSIDLYKVVKKNFRFPSYKLDYVLGELGLPRKIKHEGHDLWVKTLVGDAKARRDMKKYSMNDVYPTLEGLYDRLLPWIDGHPHHGLYDGHDDVCPNCGSDDRTREGYAYLGSGKYQRFSCNSCGRWYRSVRRIGGVGTR